MRRRDGVCHRFRCARVIGMVMHGKGVRGERVRGGEANRAHAAVACYTTHSTSAMHPTEHWYNTLQSMHVFDC